MKKILILGITFLSLLGITSCEKEEIEAYSSTDNIYFSPSVYPLITNGTLIDSTGFSFSLDPATIKERVYLLPVRVQGKVSDVDRKIKLTVDPASTAVAGTNFSLPENIVMRAGRAVDTIPITVYRTADLKNKSLTLVLNLEENESFTTNMKSRVVNVLTGKTLSFINFELSFTDQLTQPKGWVVGFFGTFSAKKFFLMCELMDLDPMMFNQQTGGVGLTVPDVQYYQSFMKRYLADQKASGNTIYEDNGTEMIFP
ncbi:hypothetical protein HNP37_001627 [Flavobacterium nitrogenifigens]|uniref:DUF4843 domain-containing protein n=2 Tax=Flavobacterium TaxID=237 RepID=A0A7W7IVX4_9FLAO|nr:MULTISPECIES: DUF4843 domain-containing protein [Flavobacterium]MBB4801566.1 hypothetical protein [Flavobacterium nitrogenifigens]MBB6386523.1 hypothetical protein [Flavobacterium notoginsengisoli]